MTLIDLLVIFLAVCLSICVLGYLWEMRRDRQKSDAMWTEHRRRMDAIRRGDS